MRFARTSLCLNGDETIEMNELKETRKQMFAQMEQKLHETWSSVEDIMF